MQFSKILNRLAYQLIYPGILGSMIFDLSDPLRDLSLMWIISFLICLIYISDYIYLNSNFMPDGQSEKWFQPIFDIFIALIFCFSYFSIARTGSDLSEAGLFQVVLLSLASMTVAQILISLYDFFLNKIERFMDITAPLFCMTGLLILLVNNRLFEPAAIIILTYSCVFFVYILRLYLIFTGTKHKKKEENIANDQP